MKRLPLLLFLLPTLLFADEVYLKGSGAISGRIVEQTDAIVMVDIGGGLVGVPVSRIERIVKGRSPLDDYDERANRLGAQDVDGWKKLGRWAAQQGMNRQARQAYEKALAIAPDDPEANEALGFVLVDGQWLTEEESYRARGYVQYNGEWMTPAEAQALQAIAEAERARQDAEQRARDAEAAARAAEASAQAAQDAQPYYDPYWGAWGYGVTTWPSEPIRDRRPVNRPSPRPSGGRR